MLAAAAETEDGRVKEATGTSAQRDAQIDQSFQNQNRGCFPPSTFAPQPCPQRLDIIRMHTHAHSRLRCTCVRSCRLIMTMSLPAALVAGTPIGDAIDRH